MAMSQGDKSPRLGVRLCKNCFEMQVLIFDYAIYSR